MWIDLSPLARQQKFRWLYLGQLVSFFGSMISHVAFPYQIYQLTKSSFAVGLIGIVQLGPLLIAGLYGGALADAFNRRRLLIYAEIGLFAICLALIWNASRAEPSLVFIYILAALNSVFFGLHRPAHEALTPRLVNAEELQAVSVLSSLRGNIGAIGGPATGGFLLAHYGIQGAYAADLFSYAFSLFCLWKMGDVPAVATAAGAEASRAGWRSVWDGLQYVKTRRDLWGTYFVDIVAMAFAMPNALFPALAEILGGPKILGWLYAAPSIGALIITLFSGWARKVKRYGQAITIAAFLWGAAMLGAGLSTSLWLVLFFLALAGAFDMVSALFRQTMWNETIPDEYRGRLAGVEMISYMSGPLVGQTQSGFIASLSSVRFAICNGGVFCMLGVALCAYWLRDFWRFESKNIQHSTKK